MTYEWANPNINYNMPIVFTVSNGVATIDCNTANAGEGFNEAQFATLMGQIKDALEGASLVVGPIYLSGGASKTLEEV